MTSKISKIALFAVLAVVSVGLLVTVPASATEQEAKAPKKSINEYYAEILPDHKGKGLGDYKEIQKEIKKQIKSEKTKNRDSLTKSQSDRIDREIVRLDKLDTLTDLKQKMFTDPENAEKYHEQGVVIMETFVEEYNDVEIQSMEKPKDAQIKQVFHQDTDVDTNTVQRYHCDAGQNLSGWFSADVNTHYPVSSDWDSVWHYPIDATNSGSPSCIEYDHSSNVVSIYGPFPFNCSHTTSSEDFRDDFYCGSINHSTTVGIYANAKYVINGYPQDYASTSWDVEYLN